MKMLAVLVERVVLCLAGLLARRERKREQQREYNRRYWLKMKENPQHYEKRKQANVENNRRFRSKKKLTKSHAFFTWPSHQ